MKVIGGFYEMLLPKESFEYHNEAVALSNGRACIRQIIKSLNITKCYLPNYTCDAVYHPFDLENVAYELYNIDEKMESLWLPDLNENEYFYYINYFGVKNNVVKKLHKKYGNKLIIDNTHDFFKKQQYNCCSFTSARKYFGVPDGAFLYTPFHIDNNYERFEGYTLSHNLERIKGNQIGEGCNIMLNVAITNDVNLGKGVIINQLSSIGHDVIVGDFVEICPNVSISGNCIIGNNSFIGTGAIILPKVRIGENVTIGAGAVVSKDLPDNCVAVGIPAKIIKQN